MGFRQMEYASMVRKHEETKEQLKVLQSDVTMQERILKEYKEDVGEEGDVFLTTREASYFIEYTGEVLIPVSDKAELLDNLEAILSKMKDNDQSEGIQQEDVEMARRLVVSLQATL